MNFSITELVMRYLPAYICDNVNITDTHDFIRVKYAKGTIAFENKYYINMVDYTHEVYKGIADKLVLDIENELKERKVC